MRVALALSFLTDSTNFAKHKFYFFSILKFAFYFKICLKNKRL